MALTVGELNVKINIDTKKLESKLKSITSNMQKLGGAIPTGALKKGFGSVTGAAKSLGGSLKGITSTMQRLGGAIPTGALTKGLGSITGAAKSLGSALTGAFSAVGASLLIRGIDSVSLAIGSAVKTAVVFEESLSGIQAVLNPTSSEMRDLEARAMDLGSSTSFGASQAAEGIEMLAKNGLNSTEILDGAIDSSLLLAAATGTDLSNAANIATDVMSSFGLEAKDLGSVVDEISGVTVNSKFNIDDYRLALAQAGGVAGTVGVELTDFNTTIAAISPLFASGSDAGTSFKTFLQRLPGGTGPANDAMRELGILTEDGSNQFFDAEGNMRSMSEVSQVLKDALEPLNEQQKNIALSTIFGTDAMRAAAGIANLGADDFDKLASSIAGVDAEQQASTRLDNLSGDIVKLKSALETVSIQLGTAFIPLMRDVVQAATNFVATRLVDRDWSPLVTGVNSAVSVIRLFIPVLISAVEKAIDFISIIKQFADDTKDPQTALTNLSNTLLVKVKGAFDSVITAVRDKLSQWVSSLQAWGAELVDWIIAAVPKALDLLEDWRSKIVDFLITNLKTWVSALGDWSTALLDWIIAAVLKTPDLLEDWRSKIVDFLITNLPTWISNLQDWGTALVDWLVVAVPKALDLLADWRSKIVDFLLTNLPEWISALEDWSIALLDWIVTAAPKVIREATQVTLDLVELIIEKAPDVIEALAKWAVALVDWIIEAAPELLSELLLVADDILDFLEDQIPILATQLAEWIPPFLDWVGETIPKLIIELGEMVGEVYTWIIKEVPDLLDTLGAWSQAFVDWAKESGLPALGDALVNIGSSLWDDIQDRFMKAFAPGSIGEAMVQGIQDGVQQAWGNLTQYIQDQFEDLKRQATSWMPDWMGGDGQVTTPPQGGNAEGPWGNTRVNSPNQGGASSGYSQEKLDEWSDRARDTSLPTGNRRLYAERFYKATGLRISAPGLAMGGMVNRQGLALVGERGPELLNLPAGAVVSPLHNGTQTSQNITLNSNINVSGNNTPGEQMIRKIVQDEFNGLTKNILSRK